MKPAEIHEELYEELLQQMEVNSKLRFRVRRTNQNDRLRKRFWFLGSEQYLAIGFWEGMNWKTRLPNIAFMADCDGGAFWLNMSFSDSELKGDFLKKEFQSKLYLKLKGNTLQKFYSNDKPAKVLRKFLKEDWPRIDEVIRRTKPQIQDELGFMPIPNEKFQNGLRIISDYRESEVRITKPFRITDFWIKGFTPIDKECSVTDIPNTTKWIFLTGENGVGKSSILRAISLAVYKPGFDIERVIVNGEPEVEVSFSADNGDKIQLTKEEIESSEASDLHIEGFAAYGAMRLETNHISKRTKEKSGILDSLFSHDNHQLNLEEEFLEWGKYLTSSDIDYRKESIKGFLEETMLNIGEVNFGYEIGEIPFTLYHEIGDDGELLMPVGIKNLSSGSLSIVNMMQDMLIRLFRQQPHVHDVGELHGLVIIDEIDIHLHPKYQKHFVERLSADFPHVQFLVSTHSPIPLLGAPEETVILNVTRNHENGVQIQRLSKLEKDLDRLLPNTILTSDIFDFDFFDKMKDNDFDKLYLEENYKDIEKNKQLDEKLKNIDASIFPDNLFEED